MVVQVLPAYAGMIRIAWARRISPYRAPRVCGDDPAIECAWEASAACSPRMRG